MTVRVLHVATELYPLLKTGGLADVAGALPPAQMQLGADARVLLPGFPAVVDGLSDLRPIAKLGHCFGIADVTVEFGMLRRTDVDPGANCGTAAPAKRNATDVRANTCGADADAGLGVYVIRADAFYDRPGNPYLDASHRPYADNGRRFALLGWAAARLAAAVDPSWTPHIVHAHDWHAGLTPAYIKAHGGAPGRPPVGTVMTVHNLAYQGVFPATLFGELGLPEHFFSMHGVEFHGQVSFLKAGLYFADRISTVSPTYAREIQTPAQGDGLDGLLRSRSHDLVGILNGVDYSVWSPAHDNAIASRYTVKHVSAKAKNKRALQAQLGLAPQPHTLLFGMISRLTEQKGVDLLLAALPEILRRGGQLAVLGTGEPALEAGLGHAAQAHPGSVAVHLGFDETLAHAIVAGSDVVMVPSRFEPCGLTQLYALAYGSLPLVHGVGGLADTVVDASLENLDDEVATGFVFERFEVEALRAAIRRAFALHTRSAHWKRTQRRAMKQDFGWQNAAARYGELYRELVTG
jgi:starch synthase